MYCSLVKYQVTALRDDLKMARRPAQVHCDGMAIKGFVTQINRKLYQAVAKKDSFKLGYVT